MDVTRYKANCCALLLFSVSIVLAAPASARWHEVLGGAWAVDQTGLPKVLAGLQAAADASPDWERKSRIAELELKFQEENARTGHAVRTRPEDVPATPPVDLSTYTVQFQGVLVHRQRMIRIAGVCSGDPGHSNVDREFLVVSGGGRCVFQALFDPSTDRVRLFGFNPQI